MLVLTVVNVHIGCCRSVAFSSAVNKRAVTAGNDGTWRVWTQTVRTMYRLTDSCFCIRVYHWLCTASSFVYKRLVGHTVLYMAVLIFAYALLFLTFAALF